MKHSIEHSRINTSLERALFFKKLFILTTVTAILGEIFSLHYLDSFLYPPFLALFIVSLSCLVAILNTSSSFISALRTTLKNSNKNRYVLPCEVGEIMMAAGCKERHVTMNLMRMQLGCLEKVRLTLFFSNEKRRVRLNAAIVNL